MHTLKAIAAALTMALSLIPVTRAHAVPFNDNFSTDPFSTPRWCERVHHVHWDSVNQLVSGVNGTSCTPAANSCCITCSSTGFGTCAGTNANGFLAISKQSYSGTDRSATVDFAMQTAFVTVTLPDGNRLGEHAALFNAVHPNCHAGIQLIVADSDGGAGQFMQIIMSTEQLDSAPRPECAFEVAHFSAPVAVNLATSTLPRYKLKVRSYIPSGFQLNILSELIDNQTGLTIASVNTGTTKQDWYNAQARRYGLGAVKYTTPVGVIPFDNFTSDSH